MASDWTRRGFLGATGMAVAAGATRLPLSLIHISEPTRPY